MIELAVMPASSPAGSGLQHDISRVLPWLGLQEGLDRAREQGRPVLCLAEHPHSNSAQRLALFLEQDPHLPELISDRFVPVLTDRHVEPELTERILSAASRLESTVSAPVLAVLSEEGLPLVTYCNITFEGDDERPSLLNLLRTTERYYREQRRDCIVEARGLQQTTSERTAANLFLPAWQLLRKPNPQLLHELLTGGIHDQLGGGFHRAARMQGFGVPHFEKIALQNAAMSTVLLRETKPEIRQHAGASLDFALRSLNADSAGLASDTEYYTWSSNEVLEALPADELQLVGLHYRISASSARHVLNQVRSVNEATELATGTSREQALAALERGKRLYNTRLLRRSPQQLPPASSTEKLLTISQLLQTSQLNPAAIDRGQLQERLRTELGAQQLSSVHEHAAALHALNSAGPLEAPELLDALRHHSAALQSFRGSGGWYYDRQHTRPLPAVTLDHELPSLSTLLRELEQSQLQSRS